MEFAQRGRATRLLQSSAGIAEPERLADPACQLRTAALLIEKRLQPRLSFRGTQRAPNLILSVHEPVTDGRIEYVQKKCD